LVRELLADDGTAWVNMGDSYASFGGGAQGGTGQMANRGVTQARRCRQDDKTGLKPKDLVGMPWRLAFALQADGWYLRQDIIWHKPNPMPESVRDRCTKAHEYIFLLSKNQRYYYDQDAIKEQSSDNTHPRTPGNKAPSKGNQAYLDGQEEHRTKGELHAYSERQKAKYKTPDGWDTSKGEGGHGSIHRQGREKGRKLEQPGSGTKNNSSFDEAMAVMPDKRNKRSVWTVASKPYSEAHFATYPPALIEPCILAGSRSGDIVLDPFFGSGTTGEVALKLGRQYIGIELNQEYEQMQKDRIRQRGLEL